MISDFEASIVNLDIVKASSLCKEMLASSNVTVDEIFRAIGNALHVVGQKYEEGSYFLSELIMAGEVVKEVMKIIEPYYQRAGHKALATVVLATVKGDLHDIGKNILAMLLQSTGFDVVDLGVDVPAENIVEAVRKNEAQILGLSSLLTTTLFEFGNVVDKLKEACLRKKIKLIIGGAAVNQEVVSRFGADAWGKTAVDGLKICEQWIMKGEHKNES